MQTTLPPVWWAAAARARAVELVTVAQATTISLALLPAARAEMNSATSGSLALCPCIDCNKPSSDMVEIKLFRAVCLRILKIIFCFENKDNGENTKNIFNLVPVLLLFCCYEKHKKH